VTPRLARIWPVLTAVLIAVAAGLVFTRALDTRTNYDEGVYLASLDAMRRGQDLGTELYTSQPPVFYWLLRTLAAPFGSSIPEIRIAFALVAILGVAAAIVLGWRLYGPPAGLVSGGLVVIGPPYPSVAPTVSADVPAVAIGLVSLVLLTFALGRGAPRARLGWASAAGAVLALAVLTKLLAAPFVVPFVALALGARAARRVLPAALFGAALATLIVAVAHAAALDDIWRQVVSDHTDARALGTLSGNADQIRKLLEPRTPFGWLVPLGFVAFLLSRRARPTWPLWTFVPTAVGFLLLVRPLADHHLVLLSVACAIAAGPSLALAIGGLGRVPQTVAASVLVLCVAAGLFQEQRRLHRNDLPDPPEVAWAIEAIERATSRDALVVTDQPIVLFRAKRETTGPLVDISNTRVTGGTLTAADVNAEIRRSRPDAVLVNRMLRFLPATLAELDRGHRWRVRCGSATLYLNSRAETPACPIQS
jgi:4-amino-4-deoxy-L-arabinose transferase-like glycosyltransferase